MKPCHVVILGGGPAGVGAAYKLRVRERAEVTLLERNELTGGNAGSFQHEGQWLDFGSHRLHHASDPEVLGDIKALLGADLKDRLRNGRIRLRGQWVKFPLNGKDLLLRLDKAFAAGAAFDMVRRGLPFGPGEGDSFASVLRAKLGPTICDHFYYPYARKLWGRQPEELAAAQAYKRVSSNSFQKLIMKVLRPPAAGFFYYPRQGFGQISRGYAEAASKAGAQILLGHSAQRLRHDGARWQVTAQGPNGPRELQADHVWSTLPISLVARMIEPGPPPAVLEATQRIGYRAMLLVYLELPVDQFTTTDAHYFPEENVRMTRLSEPKNYFGLPEPRGRTVLCAEIPCAIDDELWRMSDAELGKLVADDIRRVELPLPEPTRAFARRLPQAYPIYLKGYEEPLHALDAWAGQLPGFLSYGRQGLFAHDNTHHALAMAYGATECLRDGVFDTARWAEYRKVFEGHVVED